jgi:hypothetical protein
MLTILYFHLARLIEIVEQGECGECYPPVTLAVTWFAHREVVRERHEADPRRPDTMLHGQCNGGDIPALDSGADQSNGPVAQGSRRSEQHNVYVVFYQFAGDLGCRVLYQLGRVVDGSHK